MKVQHLIILVSLGISAVAWGDPNDADSARYRYKLDISEQPEIGFTQLSGFDIEVAPIEYRESTEDMRPRKLNGLNKYTNVHMRAFDDPAKQQLELSDWYVLFRDDVSASETP